MKLNNMIHRIDEDKENYYRVAFVEEGDYDEPIEDEDNSGYSMLDVYKVKKDDVDEWIDRGRNREEVLDALEGSDYYDHRIIDRFEKALKREVLDSSVQRVKIKFEQGEPQTDKNIVFLYPST